LGGWRRRELEEGDFEEGLLADLVEQRSWGRRGQLQGGAAEEEADVVDLGGWFGAGEAIEA
jgi:hypothetical protein